MWCLDPGVVVTPVAGTDRFECRLQGAAVEASAYQLHLLLAFEAPSTLDAIESRFPFERTSTRAFLERCRFEGLLRPAGIGDLPEPPERVAPPRRWLGAPAHDPGRPAAFTFLGLPYDGNTTGLPGARFGPAAVRDAAEGARYAVDPVAHAPVGFYDHGTGRPLLEGITLADAGDVFVSAGEDPVALYSRVTDVVADLVQAGTLPLIVGGDHSLTAPVIAGLAPGPLQIFHLDAHTDLGALERDDATRLHHGNVFSVVLEERQGLERLVQVGLRGITDRVSAVDVERVRSLGVDQWRADGMDAMLSALDPNLPTYVSIDIDVLDPAFAPSTGTPVPGGLTPWELKAILRAVGGHVPVVAADLMEVARPRDPSDGTAAVAHEALLTLADAVCDRMMRGLAPTDEDPS